jgi:hypothetical protein
MEGLEGGLEEFKGGGGGGKEVRGGGGCEKG